MKRFIIYGVVGVLAFTVEYLSFIIVLNVTITSFSLLIAQSVSFSLGLLVSFTGNRLFTFSNIDKTYAHNVRRQIGLYMILAAVNLALSNAIIYVLVHGFLVVPLISKLIVMSMVVLWNYFIFSKLIFKIKK